MQVAFQICARLVLQALVVTHCAQFDEDDAIYDEVDDVKYQQMVQERRSMNDFVVDDSACLRV